MNIGCRTETEILQKILSHSANFQTVLGSLTSKYCRQLLMMPMLLVLNNFIRKRAITKSTDIWIILLPESSPLVKLCPINRSIDLLIQHTLSRYDGCTATQTLGLQQTPQGNKTRSSAIAERPRCSLFKLW